MLHENVMMVLHWRTSSFFVVKCFLLVSSLPNSNRRYTTSFGRFESQCNNIKKLYIHHNLHNFYFNSNLFLNEYFLVLTKGDFFSESTTRFLDLQISKKKIFQKTILNLKFKIPAQNSIMLWAGILNFKFKIVFWNIFFRDLEI